MYEFDYLVIGGGSSGGVVAARLAELPGLSVALLEEGPGDWFPWIHIPGMLYKTATGGLLRRLQYDHGKEGVVRAVNTVQGEVLGGGSSVNGMLHVRGTPQDYDRWVEEGARGWGYADVLPFFKKAEGNDTFSSGVHSPDGPLKVSSPRTLHPLTKIWVQACQEAGMPFNPDFNSGVQLGCGYYQTATDNGRRSSVAGAYVHPARKKNGLHVETSCKVIRLLFENKRAVGVEAISGGERVVYRARKEIILSAGSYNSPKILLRSGIGPEKELREANIEVVCDLPGVGRNLQDHMDVYLIFELNGIRSYDHYKKPSMKMIAGMEYGLFKKGPAASNIIEGGAFWWGSSNDYLPVIQYCFLPGSGIEDGVEAIKGADGCTLNICLTQPKSRGYLKVVPGSKGESFTIRPNFLSESSDMDRMVEGIRNGFEIMSQPSISKYLKRPHSPSRQLKSYEEIASYIKAYAQGALHPVGTCKIGSGIDAVVDPELKVRGVEGLRVADASVMPSLVSGNTNAACIMIGERAAHFIASEPL
ncbi:choline dehydrogenase-like flavoprotein [Pseudomonas sp. WPR_5_2]|uniref:GMC family oxidoreductase n=1 Tax=Pseudomonas sp. WPR_5_2 TaxID=1907371 RepID=UPI000EAE2EF0|nr:GMC family oxidoreductase N-terminal domain-containing protein [Pseudomonas sp. WPR_5_2]RKS18944.1 choline dehydrogenase-like flavoprotein [Pseudomonas sp. WPR_5_2]